MGEVLRSEAGLAVPIGTVCDTGEQRGAPRFTLLIRAAKLITPVGEYMCVVRDASETGVNVRLFHQLPDCGKMLLELQNGDQHELELVWQDHDRAGLRFCGPVDISRIVESPSRFAKRPVRIRLNHAGVLSATQENVACTIQDISQQGAKVISDHRFSIDQRVKLSAAGLPEVNTKVRWRRDDMYGLVFEDTFQFGDLARIVDRVQQ